MIDSHISSKKFLPGIAWFFIVAVLVFMPGDEVPSPSWIPIPHFDKLVHFGMFGGLTFLFSLPYLKSDFPLRKKINSFLIISAIFVAWGIGVEFIQKYFAYHRSFDLRDWAADSAGVLLAFFILKKMATKRSLLIK